MYQIGDTMRQVFLKLKFEIQIMFTKLKKKLQNYELKEEENMIDTCVSKIEELKKKLQTPEYLWHCPVKLELTEDELKKWNTGQKEDLWKVILKK